MALSKFALKLRYNKGRPYNAAGYFLDREKAAQAAINLEKLTPAGIYLVLNEINPALLARSPDAIDPYLEPTTSDGDIIRRRWLPLDFDPARPAGISSTEDEHCSAQDAACGCAAWLSSLGWPAPILADSGNGAHLLYRIDLPNDADSTAVVRDAIAAIAQNRDTKKIKTDLTVFNAARIWKLYGTTARKGANMPDRPHRVARLLDVAETIQVVSIEQLQIMAAMLEKKSLPPGLNGHGSRETRGPDSHRRRSQLWRVRGTETIL